MDDLTPPHWGVDNQKGPAMTDLDELERLLAKARKGPWTQPWGGPEIDCGEGKSLIYDEGGHTFDDAALIVALRNAAPALIAELKALRRANAMNELIASTADEYGVQNNGTD